MKRRLKTSGYAKTTQFNEKLWFCVALLLRVALQALQARLQLVRYPYMCTVYLVLCRACYLVYAFV